MDIIQLAEVIPGIIIFRISDLEFCINIRDVYVIKKSEEFEELKNGSSNGSAYVKIHNINIPIIDISKNFDLSYDNKFEHQKILIVKHHSEEDELEKTFGIMVDDVVELVTTEANDNNYLLKFIPSGNNPFLSGSIFIGGREILLPNFSKIAAVFLNNTTVQK